MKTITRLLTILVILVPPLWVNCQIITPQIKANFGIDGDLRANFYNNFGSNGNDDWFTTSLPGAAGKSVIDTTGAAYIVSRYATDPDFRKLPFFRTMAFPSFSIVNNRMLLDAVFIRDYHETDSTIFKSGNKNGMSPQFWATPVAQSVPDKNEILDIMVHVRRDGPSKTDSLWMIGGISIENTTGNRYFDFEMYQTDIYYDRNTLSFYNYGPQAGHTAWQFNSAGEVTVPGDIIFTAEYSSSSLTYLEARIWVHKSALLMTPEGFIWGGSFEGDGNAAEYGYANIKPLTVGAFYTGLQNASATWAGPFKLVIGDNSVLNDYAKGQFMEFSVNLTKLGLDPVTLLGGNECGMPFRRVLVKSRSSASFTAELKDFVGPFDFFLPARADAAANVPLFCGEGQSISEISVLDPSPTSIYTWTTADGNIVGTSSGPTITVDLPGTYIVAQQLQTGCSIYASDTVRIISDPDCALLSGSILSFDANVKESITKLEWRTSNAGVISSLTVERSIDGENFTLVANIPVKNLNQEILAYNYKDDLDKIFAPVIYYRIKITGYNGTVLYSKVELVSNYSEAQETLRIIPNPFQSSSKIYYNSKSAETLQVRVVDLLGRTKMVFKSEVQKGFNAIALDKISFLKKGVYLIQLMDSKSTIKGNQKIVM
jgi:hypothetical protein